MKQNVAMIIISLCTVMLAINGAFAKVSDEVLNSIQTPNEVETSIGILKFMDGVSGCHFSLLNVKPFTMSGALPPAFGYYGLC